jgi:hypothetical protein
VAGIRRRAAHRLRLRRRTAVSHGARQVSRHSARARRLHEK